MDPPSDVYEPAGNDVGRRHDTWANYVGLLLLLIAVYGKIHREESHLHVRFEDYSDYVKKTHRLIPKVY